MFRIGRVTSTHLREKVYALRYRAYRRADAIDLNPAERFEDPYDDQGNVVLWAVTRQGEVVGSIRSMWHDPAIPGSSIPELEKYGDEIANILPRGKRLVCGNRFVIDPQQDAPGSCIPLMLLRLHVGVFCRPEDYGIAAVRAHHLRFYQRTLSLERLTDARTYPGLTSSMYLMGCDLQGKLAGVLDQTPVLRPQGYERMFLDPEYRDVWEKGLPVEL